MVDRSETEEGDMDKLQLSSDSIDTALPKKRLRVEDSEDETDLPAKKRLFGEQSKMLKNDNAEAISDKSNIDERDVKEKISENERNVSLLDMGRESKEQQGGNRSKQQNGKKIALDENNVAMDKNPEEINIKEKTVENVDDPSTPVTNTSVTSEKKRAETGANEVKEEMADVIDREENSEEEMKKRHIAKRRTVVDTEVVDGLELSVECASDREESSSESEDEKDAKPRPKTIIVKAEPNESELDCSSEGEEKSDSQRITDWTLEIKSSRAKRRSSRTSFSKLKASGSEDSQNSNSDEDYSPRTKKKMKKSPATRRIMNKRRSVESKRGRGVRRKKNAEYDDEGTMKTTKTKNGMEEELPESLTMIESDDNSEKEERSMKDGKRGRNNSKSQDKQIQMLKKYLNIAGVKVKSYNDIWADCKSNAAKIKRLKELLEKNGISGRPTLEKCKRVREENEKMREVSELDTSNIISEGRVTRARRNMENVKKTALLDTRQSRNTFRRIQTVVDSDSE